MRTDELHDLTDRELYRLSFDIAEVLVARAKCRLAEEAGVPAPLAALRRVTAENVAKGGAIFEVTAGMTGTPSYSVKV